MTDEQARELAENGKLTAKIHAILTGNGAPEAGVVHQLAYIKENMVSKGTCSDSRRACDALRVVQKEANRTWWRSIDRVAMVIFAIVTLTFGSGLFLKSCSSAKKAEENLIRVEELLGRLEGTIKK